MKFLTMKKIFSLLIIALFAIALPSATAGFTLPTDEKEIVYSIEIEKATSVEVKITDNVVMDEMTYLVVVGVIPIDVIDTSLLVATVNTLTGKYTKGIDWYNLLDLSHGHNTYYCL